MNISPFWALQGLGWGGYLVLWYVASLPVYEELGISLRPAFVRTVFYVTIGFGLTLMFRPYYRRLWQASRSLGYLVAVATVASMVGSMLWVTLFEAVKWPIDEPPFWGKPWFYFARAFVSDSFVLLAWSLLYFGIKYRQELQAQTERTLKAEALAHQARLQMLRYQLNPHFLFNALNSIRALIDEDGPRSRHMITELSEYLRFTLLPAEATNVALRDEIDAIRSYLAIEKIRFEDALQVTYDVAPDVQHVRIPGFLIHPLIENAVKYGMETSPMPLQICVRVYPHGERLHIEVSNTGRWTAGDPDASLPTGTRTGLQNVRQRLAHLFPNRHRFSPFERHGWVHAVIELDLDALPERTAPLVNGHM